MAAGELERIQTRILQRISALELSHIPNNSSSSAAAAEVEAVESDGAAARLSSILRANGVRDFSFKKVPSDYYQWPLEARRDVLGAASVDHLCKSIVLVPFYASLSFLLFLSFAPKLESLGHFIWFAIENARKLEALCANWTLSVRFCFKIMHFERTCCWREKA